MTCNSVALQTEIRIKFDEEIAELTCDSIDVEGDARHISAYLKAWCSVLMQHASEQDRAYIFDRIEHHRDKLLMKKMGKNVRTD